MPFSSEQQRKFLHLKHPDIAHAWEHGKSSVTGKREPLAPHRSLPKHVKKRKGR